MKKIAFSGTLDPITNGHMWVIGEARALADEVVVFLSENPTKKPQFSAAARKAIVEQSVAALGWGNVTVKLVKGDYTARAAKRDGIDYLIRGIRNTSDFDYENLIQQANVDVLQGAKTLFVMPPRDLGSVSSSFVRALQGPVGWHWHVQKFLPAPAYQAWIRDWLRKEWDSLWDVGDDNEASAISDNLFYWLTGSESYGSANRHYHNLNHLVHGLSELCVWAANTNAQKSDIHLLKKAFWFHDAIYELPAKDSNEEASATVLMHSDIFDARKEEAAQLIRATDHFQQAYVAHSLKDVMLGVDLAILGQSPEIYDQYARDIRKEYSYLDDKTYRTNRILVLQHFVAKAKEGELFKYPYFADLYNQQSIENCEREICWLNGA